VISCKPSLARGSFAVPTSYFRKIVSGGVTRCSSGVNRQFGPDSFLNREFVCSSRYTLSIESVIREISEVHSEFRAENQNARVELWGKWRALRCSQLGLLVDRTSSMSGGRSTTNITYVSTHPRYRITFCPNSIRLAVPSERLIESSCVSGDGHPTNFRETRF